MISKILPNSLRNKSISFKAIDNDKINEYISNTNQNDNNTNSKILLSSFAIAIGAEQIGKLLKLKDTAYIGLGAFTASMMGLAFLNFYKSSKKNQEFFNEYEKDIKYKNKFDEFIGTLSTPEPSEMYGKNNNKEYYKKYKENKMFGQKIFAASGAFIGLSTLLAHIIYGIKKAPDKFDKINNVTFISSIIGAVGGCAYYMFNKPKEDAKQA